MAKATADKDTTVSSSSMTSGPAYPEGTHPPRPVSETSFAATNLIYEDMPDDMKPDPSTVAQIQHVPDGWPAGK